MGGWAGLGMNRKKLLRKIYWTSGFLSFFILVYLGSIIFLNPSSVGSPHFGRFINIWALIWTVNFLIVVLLAFILARNLIKLYVLQALRDEPRVEKVVEARVYAPHDPPRDEVDVALVLRVLGRPEPLNLVLPFFLEAAR